MSRVGSKIVPLNNGLLTILGRRRYALIGETEYEREWRGVNFAVEVLANNYSNCCSSGCTRLWGKTYMNSGKE